VPENRQQKPYQQHQGIQKDSLYQALGTKLAQGSSL